MRNSVAFVIGVVVGVVGVVVLIRRRNNPATPESVPPMIEASEATLVNKNSLPKKQPLSKLKATATAYAIGRDGGYYSNYDYFVGDQMKVATRVASVSSLNPASIQMVVNGKVEIDRKWGEGEIVVVDAGEATSVLTGNHKLYAVVTMNDRSKVRTNVVSLSISPVQTVKDDEHK